MTELWWEKIWWGPHAGAVIDVPVEPLLENEHIFASCSGPDVGLCYAEEPTSVQDDVRGNVAGASSWNSSNRRAYGISLSLYEQNPITHKLSGEPIADTFALCARKRSAILMIADGVNWGDKSKLAARCAIYGAMKYLNKTLSSDPGSVKSTRDAITQLREAIDVAQATIIAHDGGLTTFCAALVLPLASTAACNAELTLPPNLVGRTYAVCIVNVGDSLAFILSKHYGLREVTIGSHDLRRARDVRDAGGALGPVNGHMPALDNLTCSVTFSQESDIVFLTTDGVSDNFDPVVTKVAMPAQYPNDSNQLTACSNNSCSNPVDKPCPLPLPRLEMLPHERHQLAVKSMEMSVHEFELGGASGGSGKDVSAQELCRALMQRVIQLTECKRKIIEDSALYWKRPAGFKLTRKQRQEIESDIRKHLAVCPGKLDHASVVAYEVGCYKDDSCSSEAQVSTTTCPIPLTARSEEHGQLISAYT